MQQSETKKKNNSADVKYADELNENSASIELKNVCRGFGDEWNREEVIRDFTLL